MKHQARVRVGEVEVAVSGVALTVKDVRALLRAAASIAVALTPEPPEPPEPNLIGFSAPILERLPDSLPDEPGED